MKRRFFARARGGRVSGPKRGMNGAERAYAAHLDERKAAGEVLWWAFEPVKLKLAPSTFYGPDFAVVVASGELEFHEVKGHWEDTARVKVKVAAELFPFRFVAVKRLPKKNGGGWVLEDFGADDPLFRNAAGAPEGTPET